MPQSLHNPDDEIRADRRAITAQNTILTLDLGFAVLKRDPVCVFNRSDRAAFRRDKVPPDRLQRP